MSQTVTLRLEDSVYQKFKSLATHDNRPLSNYIQTAALRFVEEREVVDEFEMAEIRDNSHLKLGDTELESSESSILWTKRSRSSTSSRLTTGKTPTDRRDRDNK